MKKSRIASFVAGVLVSILVITLAIPALAALPSKNVTIYPGVNIYLNEQKLNPTDVNGNPVEVFIYNGTTYLPVRAVSETLDIPVQWEGSTSSVYLGLHTGDKPAVWLENLDYFSGVGELELINDAKDNLGNTYSHAVCNGRSTFSKTYLINGQYSAISGTLFQMYQYRSASYYTSYIEIWGDGNQLYRGEVAGGKTPVDFNIDLNGVLELQVKIECNNWNNNYAGVADLGLWT